MAMNKAEKQQLDDALTQVSIYKAFHITPEVKPDLKKPLNSGWDDAHIYGYKFNEFSSIVTESWSTSNRHGRGHGERINGQQGGIDLFSTRSLALQAMRHKLAMNFAKKLANVDFMIDKEVNNETV